MKSVPPPPPPPRPSLRSPPPTLGRHEVRLRGILRSTFLKIGIWLFSTATTCSRHRLPGAIHRACTACLPCLHPHARLQPLDVSAASPTCASPNAAGTALPRSTSTTIQPLVHTRDTLRRRGAREVRPGLEPTTSACRSFVGSCLRLRCRLPLPPAARRVPRASVPQPIRTRHAPPSHTPRVSPSVPLRRERHRPTEPQLHTLPSDH